MFTALKPWQLYALIWAIATAGVLVFNTHPQTSFVLLMGAFLLWAIPGNGYGNPINSMFVLPATSFVGICLTVAMPIMIWHRQISVSWGIGGFAVGALFLYLSSVGAEEPADNSPRRATP